MENISHKCNSFMLKRDFRLVKYDAYKHFLYFQLYLLKCGYLKKSTDQEISTIFDQGAISNAIKDFQAFAGLNKTGNCTFINI